MNACSSTAQRAAAPTTTSAVSSTIDPDQRATETTETPRTTVPAIPSAALADLAELEGALVLRDDGGSLVVMQPDGSDPEQIASGVGALLSQPTFSRSGERVAWSSIDAGGAELFVSDADGSNAVSAVVTSPAFYLSWSPDDSWIAALRPTAASIEFVVADPATADVRPVATGQPFYFDWRDDDSLVAAVESTSLTIIQASGDVPPTLRPMEAPLGAFQTPAVIETDDDTFDRLVVAVLQDGFNDVVLLGPNAGQDTIGRTTSPVAITTNPVEQRVAVLVVDAEPQQSQVINFQPDAPPDLPSGRVSIIDIETGEVTTRAEGQIVAMQWSPDGSRLALLQAGNNALQWLIAGPDGVSALTPFAPSQEFATAYLPFADQYNHSSSWWSPDSRALVVSGSIGGQTGVWVDLVDDDLGAVRVSDGDLGLWSPR